MNRPSHRPLFPALCALLLAWVSACASIDVDAKSEGGLKPGNFETFAWRFGPDADAGELDAEIRAAIQDELLSRGFREVALDEADLLVSFSTEVATEQRVNDPYFGFTPAEVVETGTLTIEISEIGRSGSRWTGTGESELRRAATRTGPFSSKLSPTGQDRDWRVPQKVSAILEQIGAAR